MANIAVLPLPIGSYQVYIPDNYTGDPAIRAVCPKSECQQKERELKQKIKDEKEKEQQEKSANIQEQIENYKELEKEINDIVADSFVY
ncbi:1263_t:CDS:2 [Cetraspora pellucida]|uniref:1263_t:CDS:1 n=1 Tax=Cetraspora pellucida TaxID=1433469 RepID=A0ACA9MN52_9GLOM|nr:1263_t:CDS:2 [Cetraspora pellucida]